MIKLLMSHGIRQERLIISNAASTSAQTEEMQAKVQELALLRDSNETLRSESKRATDRARSLGEKVAHLESQLVPLREQINSLGADLETRDGQIKLLEEDNNRWKSRNEQVLVKYDRIDPAELQGLKDRVESLQKERDTIESARSASEEQVRALFVVT